VRRLALAPVVVGPVAAAAVALYVTGYLWPVITTAWSLVAPRRETAETEADVFG
jgi:hypothetical protein